MTTAFRKWALSAVVTAAVGFVAYHAFQMKFDAEFLKGTLAQACIDLKDKSALSERVQESCRKHVERLNRIMGEKGQ